MNVQLFDRTLMSRKLIVLVMGVAALTVACGQAAPSPTATTAPTAAPAVEATSVPTTPPTAMVPDSPTSTPVPTPTPEPAGSPLRLEIIEGSEARYIVTEQFARSNSPFDAIGETEELSGAIVFDANGGVVTGESMLVVDLRTLRSDDDDRDDFLRGESLESDRFPFAEFSVTEVPGLPWPLPEEGEAEFQLVGDMALHDTTSALAWEVTAQFMPGRVEGTAKTNFDFGTFHMVRPSKFFLLSVEDNIRLELDFVVSVTELTP